MSDSTARLDRAPATYDPSTDSYEQRMDVARAALAGGDRAAAERALEAAIAIAEGTADGSPALALALARLGEIKHLDGKQGEAEQLFRRALEINERALGQEHPDLVVLLNDLSRLYLKRGAHSEAEPLLLRLHAIKRAKGEDHPEVATVLASLASVKQALGLYDAAEQLWRRVLDIRERTLAPHHFSIATALEHLGDTCAARGKLNEALRHRLRALAMREMTLDPGHPSLRTARERIADLQLQASEEVLDIEAPDATHQAPVWLPVAPQGFPVAPVAPTAAAPPRVQASSSVSYQPPFSPQPAAQIPPTQPVARLSAEPAPASRATFADDDLLDDHPARGDGADTGGLHLVNVAGVGDASRSVIMPYYAEALALAEESAEGEGFGGRPSRGFASSTVAFVRRRQAAIVAGVGAGVLILGAIGAQSFARSPGGEGATGEGDFRRAPVGALAPDAPGAAADSATAAGSLDASFMEKEREADGARVPDEPAAQPNPARSAAVTSRAPTAPIPPSSDELPRALNVRVDPMLQVNAPAAGEALAARVTLPTGGRLQSPVSGGEGESRPALLIVAPTPTYPASLYTSSIAGAASVEFVVDTNGRVDLSTFKSQSNHELFTEAVRHIMPDMRFVPSTRDGRRVRSSMRMRFEFNKSGVSSSRQK